MAKKRKRGNSSAAKISTTDSLGRKIRVAWKNLVLFAILFAFSFILYKISSSTLFLNLFGTLLILFGFITFALLIVLIVLFAIKALMR